LLIIIILISERVADLGVAPIMLCTGGTSITLSG